MSYNTYSVNAEDIDEEDFRVLSQTSNYSHTTHDEGLIENEDNCEYLPSSEDLSSQEFSSQDFSQKSSQNEEEDTYFGKKDIEVKESGRHVDLLGDGTFDSPGFSAYYCTYFLMDFKTGKVLGLWVATKEMASSSSMMEPLAAQIVMMELAHEHDFEYDSLTTDRSTSMKSLLSEIEKFLPEGFKKPAHYFDIWHMIKSVKKDLWKASKLKSCMVLSAWMTSINNQMWWAFGTSIGNEVLLKEKLLSIISHLTNCHSFENNVAYKKCQHGDLETSDEKPWLKKNSLAISKVEAAIRGHKDSRLEDLAMMTNFTHTGFVENLNSVKAKYAPKRTFFSHPSMLCKAALTAIDNNINSDRAQGRTASGRLKFDLVTGRDGSKYFVKPVLEAKDTTWRDSMSSVVLQAFQDRIVPPSELPLMPEFKQRVKAAVKPLKEDAVAKHQSRMKVM